MFKAARVFHGNIVSAGRDSATHQEEEVDERRTHVRRRSPRPTPEAPMNQKTGVRAPAPVGGSHRPEAGDQKSPDAGVIGSLRIRRCLGGMAMVRGGGGWRRLRWLGDGVIVKRQERTRFWQARTSLGAYSPGGGEVFTRGGGRCRIKSSCGTGTATLPVRGTRSSRRWRASDWPELPPRALARE